MLKKNITIKNKFIITTVVILISFFALSLFMISMINRLANITQDIIDHPLEVSNAASYANVEVLRMHKDLKEILLVEEDYELNILVDKIRVAESQVYVALDIIAFDILGQEGKDIEQNARGLFDEWKSIRSEIIDAVRSGHRDEALEITRVKGADHIEALERKLIELNQYARKKAEQFQERSIDLKGLISSITVVSIVLNFAIVAAAILWMSMSILGGIGKLSKSLNDILSDGEFRSVELSGDDELSELSNIFNKLVKSLRSQIWVKEGNQRLNSSISGENDFITLIQNFSETLCLYGDFLSVAYYHRTEEELALTGVVNRMLFMNREYTMGDYSVGECAKYNKPIQVTYEESFISNSELPYYKISWYPVSYKEEVYGVLTIVFKDLQTPEQEELLESTIKDLSAYLATYEQRKKIDDLLEDFRRTNEELTERQVRLEENTDELEAANFALQEQRDLLNDKSRELEKQNEELIKLRVELVRKYEDLEEVSNFRSQFLTNISHELRTPLNSILVLSEILKGKKVENFDESDIEKITVLNKAGNELLITINDILDLSKLESGKILIQEALFNFDEMMKEIDSIYNPVIENKGLKGIFNSEIHQRIFGDKDKISHILTNFISNAIKFTKEGGITVNAVFTKDVDYPIRIDVIDTGIGIEEHKFEVIFEEFVQSDGSISRLYGGTGLGLSICKNYSNLINAKVTVESVFNEGSIFSLLLPSTSIVIDQEEGLDEIHVIESEEFPNKLSLGDHLIDQNVLICDDEAMNIFSLSSMLENIGVNPIEALTAEEAIDILKENDGVDMVMMDYMMPEMSGLDALKIIKTNMSSSKISLVLVTAATLQSKEMKIIKEEGFVLLRKPIVYNEVVKLLNNYL